MGAPSPPGKQGSTGVMGPSRCFHQSWSGGQGAVSCARQQLYRINKVMSPCFISPIVSLYCAVVRRLAGAPVIYRGTWRMQPAPLGAPRGTPATTPAPHPARLLYQLHVLVDYFGISIVFAVVACYVYCAAVRADWVFAVFARAPSVNCIRNARAAAPEFPKMIVFAVTSELKFETNRRRVESQIVPTYRITGGLHHTVKSLKRISPHELQETAPNLQLSQQLSNLENLENTRFRFQFQTFVRVHFSFHYSSISRCSPL